MLFAITIKVVFVLFCIFLWTLPKMAFAYSQAFLWENGEMTFLGTLGGTGSFAYGINNRGQVVGMSSTGSGIENDYRGFFWEKGKMTDFGTLPGDLRSDASGINYAGQVVGVSYTELGAWTSHAYLWQNGVMMDLGTMGGVGATPGGINSSAQVVGTVQMANGDMKGFLWENGNITDLGSLGGNVVRALAINDLGQIVGFGTTSADPWSQHAFIWQNGVMTDLGTFGDTWSRAYSINNLGQIVGSYGLSGESRAFLWQNGVFTDLGSFGEQTEARGINDAGQIIVNDFSGSHAYYLNNGQVTDLGPGTLAYGLNDLGQVVGVSYYPIPIPCSFWLLGSGLIGLAGLRRKFKK